MGQQQQRGHRYRRMRRRINSKRRDDIRRLGALEGEGAWAERECEKKGVKFNPEDDRSIGERPAGSRQRAIGNLVIRRAIRQQEIGQPRQLEKEVEPNLQTKVEPALRHNPNRIGMGANQGGNGGYWNIAGGLWGIGVIGRVETISTAMMIGGILAKETSETTRDMNGAMIQ